MKIRRGFTLIELLVVIAIIAILAAILFPVFAQAKRAAKTSAALSNTKQIILGSLMYSTDVDDLNPPVEMPYSPWLAWGVMLQPYLKNTGIAFDPARTVPYVPIDSNGYWGWYTTMAVNMDGWASNIQGWDWSSNTRSNTSMEHEAERLAFSVAGDPASQTDWNEGWGQMHHFMGSRMACPDTANPLQIGGGAQNDEPWNFDRVWQGAHKYHGDNIVGSFADGHSKGMKAAAMTRANQLEGGRFTCRDNHFLKYAADSTLTPSDGDLTLHKYWGRGWDPTF